MKRYRAPKAKPGELLLKYGKLPNDHPDVCIAWGGEGADKRDANLIFNTLCDDRYKFNSTETDCSLVEELKKRGYDITTIKFSIRKTQPQEGE